MVWYTGSWGNAGLEDRKIINKPISKKMNIWMMMVVVIFVTTDWSGPLSYMSFCFYKQDLFPSHKEHWNTVCRNAFGTLLFLKNYIHTWIVLARQQFWFKKKLYRHMNCSCAIFCLGKALAGTLNVYFNMLKAPINLKQMQITSTCHCAILFILKVQKRLLNFQNSSQFSEEENSETTF